MDTGNQRRVLIETYWNVNYFLERMAASVSCINRNILECK